MSFILFCYLFTKFYEQIIIICVSLVEIGILFPIDFIIFFFFACKNITVYYRILLHLAMSSFLPFFLGLVVFEQVERLIEIIVQRTYFRIHLNYKKINKKLIKHSKTCSFQ